MRFKYFIISTAFTLCSGGSPIGYRQPGVLTTDSLQSASVPVSACGLFFSEVPAEFARLQTDRVLLVVAEQRLVFGRVAQVEHQVASARAITAQHLPVADGHRGNHVRVQRQRSRAAETTTGILVDEQEMDHQQTLNEQILKIWTHHDLFRGKSASLEQPGVKIIKPTFAFCM